MQVRAGWVVLGPPAGGGGAGTAAPHPGAATRARERQARADRAAAEIAADAVPVLYRWRDANGVLHVTDTPPEGRKYERVPRE